MLRIKVLLPDPKGQHNRLVKALRRKDVIVQDTENGLFVVLADNANPTNRRFKIYPGLPTNAEFFIEATEHTEKYYGKCTVVCGPDGQKLVPGVILKGTSVIGGDQAYFGLPDQIVTVGYNFKNDLIKIKSRELEVEQDRIWVRLLSRLIWRGHPNELSPEFGQFENAVRACLQKVDCCSCEHVHYAQI